MCVFSSSEKSIEQIKTLELRRIPLTSIDKTFKVNNFLASLFILWYISSGSKCFAI